MSKKSFLLASVFAAGACALSASAATAATTITYINQLLGAVDTQAATEITGVVDEHLTASLSGYAKSPYEGTSFYGATYVAVTGGSTASYSINATNEFALLWGTPDSYNTLSFYLDGVEVGSVTGSQITSQAGYTNAAYVRVTTDSLFDEVVFSSGQNSFEYAIPTVDGTLPAVPLPAAGWLMLGGLGALGAVRKLRKN